MIIEISVAVIALSLVILVSFLVACLFRICKLAKLLSGHKKQSPIVVPDREKNLGSETMGEVVNWIAASVDLYKQIKAYSKHHGKTK